MSNTQTPLDEQAFETGSRGDLKNKFSDNKTPTGNDFADLIDSSINQLDDGIEVGSDTITTNKKIIVTAPDALTASVEKSSFISHDQLNIADQLVLAGEEGSEALKVYQRFEVHKSASFDGGVAVAKAGAMGEINALDVTGNTKLTGNMSLSGELTADGELTANGHIQLNNGLDVTGNVCTEQALTVQGRAEFQQAVNIGGVASTTADALLNIQNKVNGTQDLLRLEDTTEDPSPVVVKGNGRVGINNADPKNLLEVIGNVRIGTSETMGGMGNSLSVENRVGIGTASPAAMLDVDSTGENELVNIRKNDKTLVKIKVAENDSDAEIQLNSRTQVDGALTVTGLLTAGSTDVNGALSASSAIISGKSDTGSLVVGGHITKVNGPQSEASATFNVDVNAKGLTSLQETDVYDKLNAKAQLSAQKANVREKLAVGLPDDSTVDAVLQIKGAGADSSALLVSDYENKDVIRVKKAQVNIGLDSNQVNLTVKGNTQANSLTVTGLSSLTDTSISKHLSVGESGHDISSDSAEHARFCLTSDTQTPKAIHVKYKNGDTETDLLSSHANKIGFHCLMPEADFHVGAASLFDGNATFASGFQIKGAGTDTASFSANSTQVSLGTASTPVPFNIFGNTGITGDLNVNALVNINENTFTLTQHAEVMAFKIKHSQSPDYIHALAGKLAMNTPLSDYHFALQGDAKIAGRLVIEDNNSELTALDVTGSAVITDQFSLQGAAFLNDAVTVNGPLTVSYNGLTDNVATEFALNVNGHGAISQSLTVSDALIVDNGLTVSASGTFNDNLSVSGAADFSQTLTVTGRITAEDELHIQGNNDTGLSITVDKRADFRDNLMVSGDIGFSTLTPEARLHIHQTDAKKTAFKIDGVGGDDHGLIFKQGKLGIGIDEPSDMLEVAGTAKVHQDLHVKRQAYLDNCLYVDQLATFSSNIKVHGVSELNGQTVIGDLHCPDNDEARTAQLCVFQNNYASAFKVMFENDSPVVFSDGKLGVGTESPTAQLDVRGKAEIQGGVFVKDAVEIRGPLTLYHGADVWGDVVLHSDLTVNDNTVLEDTLDVRGQTRLGNTLDVSRAGRFSSTLDVTDNVTFSANLEVNTLTHLRGDLTVSNVDAAVTLTPPTLLENTLTVNRASRLKGKVQLDDTLAIGGDIDKPLAQVHLKATSEQAALIVDIVGTSQSNAVNQADLVNSESRALTLDASGRLGLNCSVPSATLDVQGDVHISSALTADKVILQQALTFATGHEITNVSDDVTLGGDDSSDAILPTQAAVKTYIDEKAWGFGNSQTLIINNQTEFDAVFNGGELTFVPDNTTILLFPLMRHSAVSREYLLKNPVRLGTGVSVIGFNEKSTYIVKANGACRFIIQGDSALALVEGIKMSGFTFDGKHYLYSGSGGAFELKYARYCQLNCRIINHKSALDGGAIYAHREIENHTVSDIEALNIQYCSAENNAGGGAYGLADSNIFARDCVAKYGGGAAYCHNSKVQSINNTASMQGGGAYLCKNLICEGYWKSNHATEGQHIYANNCQSSAEGHHHDEKYYWHGLYLDGPIIHHKHYWRTDNI
ncbi:hypothetical protein [uncultured Shewanella sp.]|uniref:hypothetical protein n=1 Tax=uncultured Shewanella sp. TaxID=173975 RepID=UPI0026378E71|nr:hypothetical protein [uncultured Shewanella sp.]